MRKLIVGLGNPDKKYAQTRHNLGFLMADLLAGKDTIWTENKKFNCLLAEDADLLYIKPLTYMNNSGDCVSKVVQFYKIPLIKMCVIHDDKDIEFPDYKFQYARNAAGHHGVEDIIQKVGSNEFWRVRIGLEKAKDESIDTKNWVLSPLSAQELHNLGKIMTDVWNDIDTI